MEKKRGARKPGHATESAGLSLADDWHGALLEQTLAGIYLIQDGQFRYVNQEFANIFGYASPAEIVDKLKISELIAPEDREKVIENVRRRDEGEVQEMRYSFVGLRRDGQKIHVEVHGRAAQLDGRPAVIGLTLDITQRKLAEAAADEKLAALFEHSLLGIALVDRQGRHLECNSAYQRLLGCSDETLNATDMWSLIPARFAERAAAMQQALDSAGSYDGVELEFTRKDGQPVAVQTSGVRITGSDGRQYMWSIVEDITQRKRLETEMAVQLETLRTLNERLKETQLQLLQAEKMSAVGQLAAGVAHEINNPVGFVKSNLGTLQTYLSGLLGLIGRYEQALDAGAEENSPRRHIRAAEKTIDYEFIREDAPKLLQESLEGIERVKRIVSDLREFSRLGQAEWQIEDVHHCIDSALNVAARELADRAEVVKAYGQLPPIRCMPFQLTQVFMNLLVNAAQAIPQRGTISIRTGRTADSVWVEVEDSGVGIPAENLARVFDPFFTTKPVGQGTGLGLAVSYAIVHHHGGNISVRSTDGAGTVFRVVLPVDQGTPSARHEAGPGYAVSAGAGCG